MTRQERKADAFRALHAAGAFVIPNPWDAGSARVLAALGFKALATTSSGFAFTLGRRDGRATLDEVVEHAGAIDRATDLTGVGRSENGYGPDPEDAASAIQRVAAVGAVGGSIEDYDPSGRIYDLQHAGRESLRHPRATRDVGFPFMLTARRRITSAATRISRTRSPDCRHTSTPGPTSCTRPGSGRLTRSALSARQCPSR